MERTNIDKAKCLIVGAGSYGQVYAKYLAEEYDVIGFVDDDPNLRLSEINNIQVLGDIEYSFVFLEKYRDICVFVPLGNNALRKKLLSRYSQMGVATPSFIHTQTIIHDTVRIGEGVYILPGVNIMPEVVIGDYVMISMGVNIAHHTTIEKGCFFSQGTNIGASIHIKEQAYFGIACTIMTGVKSIGQNSIIGAGAMVIRDVQDHAVLVGNPAKVLRFNK